MRRTLRRAFSQTPFDHGVRHPAQDILESALMTPEGPEKIYLVCANLKESGLAANTIGCLGYIRKPATPGWRSSIIRKGLASRTEHIRDNTLCTAGNWRGRELLPILQAHRERVPYLREYLERLIREIAREPG